MMNITKTVEGEKLTVALEGRLDTLTAPELEESLSSASTPRFPSSASFAKSLGQWSIGVWSNL